MANAAWLDAAAEATASGEDLWDLLGAAACLRARALETPDAVALRYLRRDGLEAEELSFGRLDLEARRLAAWLRLNGRGGDRVLLAHAPGPEFVGAFFACLYAGLIAVPAFPPRKARHGDRVGNILRDAGCALALADAQGRAALEAQKGEGGAWARLRWPEPGDWAGLPPLAGDALHRPEPDAVAFLQYTSGSTGNPKGVMVTHAGLRHNLGPQAAHIEFRPGDVMVSWVPFFHDMGLVHGLLLPLRYGGRGVYFAPNDFLRRPLSWLQALSGNRGTHSCAPNFAFDLCARAAEQAGDLELDLSAWRYCVNGSEPVRAEPMRRFEAALARCGLRPGVVQACYGMAENTLYIAMGEIGSEPLVVQGQGGHSLVACGRPKGQTVLVVDPESLAAREEGEVGEIWVRGASAAKGYWNRPEESAAAFRAALPGRPGAFLRTGDLGFWRQGSLVVSGRLKDLIIVRGAKHHPEDLEATAKACVPGLGQGAAFSVPGSQGEAAVLVQEAGSLPERDWERAARDIARAFGQDHGLALSALAFTPRRSVPVTSSGKVQRRACRASYLDGDLKILYRWPQALEQPAPVGVGPEVPASDSGAAGPGTADAARCHPAMESLWAFQKAAPASHAYHVSQTLRLEGNLDPRRLAQALDSLAQAEPALRSRFTLDEEGRLWQEEGPLREPGLRAPLERPWTRPGTWEQAQAWFQDWNRVPFDPGVAPLWRAAWLPLEGGACALGFVFHHLITDRRSVEIFYERLDALLTRPDAVRAFDSVPWPEPDQDPAALARDRDYWSQALQGLAPEAWWKRSAGPEQDAAPRTCEGKIPAQIVDQLKRRAVEGRCTLFTVAAQAWAEALAQASGGREACFLVPSTLRGRPQTDGRLGYLVHPLPLRLDASPERPLSERLALAWKGLRSGLEHRRLNAAQALRQVGLPAPGAVLNYHAQDWDRRLDRFAGLAARLSPLDNGAALMPLCLDIADHGAWDLRLDYDPGVVEAGFARRCLEAFVQACGRFVGAADPGAGARLSLVRGPEPKPSPYATVLDAFHDQARRAPQALALVWDQGRLSYSDLEVQVHVLAGSLFQAGIRPGDRVGVCSQASAHWVAALLACFEASAVYVPLDPSYPPERLKMMLEDAACKVVFSDHRRPDWSLGWKGPWMFLEQEVQGKLPFQRSPGQPRPEDPAYLIFTSGSTGRPKGVQVGHRALVLMAQGVAEKLQVAPDDRVLQNISISFDPSLLEVLPILTSGAAVVLSPRARVRGVAEFAEMMRRNEVSLLFLSMAYWRVLMRSGGLEQFGSLERLRACIVGGEELTTGLAKEWNGGLPRVKLYNSYGPTEACVCVSFFECVPDTWKTDSVPLGDPLPGVELLVMNDSGASTVRGGAGELWIAGATLADGYLSSGMDLDKTRFVMADPDGAGARPFYPTGDLVVMDEAGSIVYKGRKDREFKAAGIRMDLGEIEAALAQAEGVSAAVVEKEGNGEDMSLSAWVLAKPGARPDAEGLRAWVKQRIHAACVPASIAVLDAFPLGPNGKVDRAALKRGSSILAQPSGEPPALERRSQAPELLETLRQAFSQVLNQAVASDDDFFALGGTSLRAVRLAGELSRSLGRGVRVDQLYQAPTPRSLAALLSPSVSALLDAPRPFLRSLCQGPGPAWVLLPPGSGRLACYRNLARLLEGRCAVWGVDLAALPAPEQGDWQGWVRAVAEALDQALPDEELVLGGWSMGGLLATDLARGLMDRGRAVRRLLLMDSYLPDPLGKALVVHDPYLLEDAMARDLESGEGLSSGVGPAAEEERRRYRCYALATARYELGPIPVPLSLVLSERSAHDEPRGAWMAWSLMARAGMTCRLVPGDHHSVLRDGNLRRLTEFLLEDLGPERESAGRREERLVAA